MIEIKKDTDFQFRVVVKSPQGQTLLESVPLDSEAEAATTLENIVVSSKQPIAFERKTNHEGKFHFNLRDIKGKVLGTSLSYHTEAGMENGIRNIQASIAG